MPAPNAAALGKFGDYTVGNFTGVPDISIPIYTVQEGPLSLPVGINYHASGLKIQEMASWVGAGWSLNAGGIISRTVMGIKDESIYGYWNTGTTLETRVIAAGSDPVLNGLLCADMSTGVIDGEPDMFSFNVGGYSGKFYIDKLHNANFIPKQDLKLEIDMSNGVLEGFTIIAPDGTRYTFGRVLNTDGTSTRAQEMTLQEGQSSSDLYTTSWYLLKVCTPDQKYKITLTYDDEGYSYLSTASLKYNVQLLSTTNAQGYQYSNTSGDATHKTRRTYMSGKKLIGISSTTETLNFISNNLRTDLDYYTLKTANSLDKITIQTGTLCQEFDFAYTYYSDPTQVSTFSSTNSISQKLRLESLKQKSCDGTITNPPYIFTYQGNYLAHRLSKAVDHWGFANGAIGNDAMSDNIPPTTVYNSTFNNFTFGAANRETNETEMLKGVIKDITFPTGGKTTFTFEANTYSVSQQSPPVYVFNLVNCSNPANSNCCGFTYISGNYTITQDDINTGRFTLQLTKTFNTTNPSQALCTGSDPNTHIYVYDAVTGAQVGTYGLGMLASQSNPSPIDLPISYLGTLSVGKAYRFELDVNNGYSTFKLYNQPWVPVNKKIGGLRVKQIQTTDGISTANDIVKQYDYSSATNANASSGVLLRMPKYGFDLGTFPMFSTNQVCILNGGSGVGIFFSDESVVPMYSFEGNHIGYQYVKETQSGNNLNAGNGTKLYRFNVALPTANGSMNPNIYPTPPLDPVVTNGQISNLWVNNSSGVTIKQTANQFYQETISYNIGKIRKFINMNLPPPSGTSCTGGIYAANFYTDYQIRTLPYRLASVTETLDGVPVTTTYTYSTDPTQPLFPLTISMTNSDGKATLTNNKYVTHTDYNADPVAIKLRALNIIANPIEMTTSVAGVQVNGARTIYGFFDITSGLPTTSTTNSFPYPFQFYKYKMSWDINGNAQVFPTNNGWDLEGTINAYDPLKAKPTQINLRAWENATQTNATEVYTWETNGLIKTRKFKDFTWQYTYLPNTKLVSQITDKDGQSVNYIYDHLLRLTTVSARNGAVTTGYTYTYQDPAQSNQSWVETKTTFTSVIGGTLSNNTTYKTIRQYLDGLGRPVQNIAVANSPNMKDVVSVVAYDNQGREYLKYDPFESVNTNGAFVATIPSGQPFSKIEYEASPLNRVNKTTPPGWQPTLIEYGTNTGNEAYDNTGNAYFAANTLHKITKTDPDGRVSKVYTDIKGRKAFTMNIQNGAAGGAYMIYSYDDKDRMNKVYPQRNAWQEWVYANDLDFSYLYDVNDNMIRKKLPDIAAVNMQYNYKNQLVLMQDGNRLAAGNWLATQYDDHGRPSATGFATSTSLDANFNPTLSTTLTSTDYSSTAGADLGKPIRTRNYFGTYLETFLQYDAYGRLANSYSNNQIYSPGGAITATNFSEKIAINYDLADDILTKVRTHKPNASTSRTITETMDYDNGLRLKQMKHQIDAMPEQILSYMDYTVKNQVATKRMGKTGSYGYLQKVDYSYNSLGWLTGINSPAQSLSPLATIGNLPNNFSPNSGDADLDYNDLFSMDLKYELPNQALAPSGTTAKGEYGGNISQISWQVRGREQQAYTFQYDFINRMTTANYSDISNVNGAVTGGKYDEVLTYDIRGNINSLQRNGLTSVAGAANPTWGTIDNLTYNYGSYGYNIKNQLQSVYDASNTTKGFKTVSNGSYYSYDANGNLTSDPNKNITGITYNHLNLPITISFSGGNTITFMYDAGGNKLRKTVSGSINYVQDYVGGIEYRSGVLEAIYHAEGRVTNINGGLKYEYAIKDHLGNTRIMFCDKNGNGRVESTTAQETSEITQENHYYPFGLNMEGTWCNTPSVPDTKYQYNGKELNDDFGLGWMDYGARMYDAAIGRWNAVDPMIDKYHPFTPYNYVFGNPIRLIDPNGMDPSGGYGTSGTDSKNTWALAQDGSMVGGSGSHFEEAPKQNTGSGTNTPTNAAELLVAMLKWYAKNHHDIATGVYQNSNRPSFSSLSKNFPDYDMTPRQGDSYGANKNSAKDADPATYTNYELFTEIGGTLGSQALNGNRVEDDYKYTCATRVCFALNKSDAEVTKGVSGKQGKYLTSVLALADYLGKPDVLLTGTAGTLNNSDSQLHGQKGIIFFKITYSDANGHFALWNGSSLIGGGAHGNDNFTHATQISLWKFK